MLRLVIPVDGSEASLRAIDTALRLAKETAVEAVLVHVREGGGDLPRRPDAARARAHRRAGAVGALLLGSVTQRVVHNATVPVLLVK